MRIFLALLLVSVSACADEEPVTCHFASGRACPQGVACLGEQGAECNYSYCSDDGQLVGGAVACASGNVATTSGGPYDCDPTSLRDHTTPPPAPCPLGALWTIEDGSFGACVPVAECRALACDPQYGDDGCPSSYRCDAGSSTCVATAAVARA